MKLLVSMVLIAASLSVAPMVVGSSQEPLDGPGRIFHDELIDNLVGRWALTRRKHGKESEHSVDADWVLNHQFLRIHMVDKATPPAYEALVFLGYDNTSERYVAHWLDVGGGRYSETLGYGLRDGNSIRFLFEYPDGPFKNTFTWHPDTKSWTCVLENKTAKGEWATFAEDQLRRTQ